MEKMTISMNRSYNPIIHHRHTIRFEGYDYTRPGAYFVTLVTLNRECLFGEISNGQLRVNLVGQCVSAVLQNLSNHFDIFLDTFVIMPNHVHFLIIIKENEQATSNLEMTSMQDQTAKIPILPNGTTPNSLGAIIQNFKSVTTRKINCLRSTTGGKVWQRNYFERIIRNEKEMERIRLYIKHNPMNWLSDDEYRIT